MGGLAVGQRNFSRSIRGAPACIFRSVQAVTGPRPSELGESVVAFISAFKNMPP
jgi:hypothetical protein